VPVVQISGLGLDAPPQHYASPGRIGPYGVPCRVVRPRGGGAEIRADLIDAEQVHAAITDLWPALKTSVERG
jgi:hypothetical protein